MASIDFQVILSKKKKQGKISVKKKKSRDHKNLLEVLLNNYNTQLDWIIKWWSGSLVSIFSYVSWGNESMENDWVMLLVWY